MALLRFDQFQEQRLYGDGGFYMSGGAAGAGGDFFTAPELGNEFARAVGAALDTRWNLLGRPNPFVVVEGGAGSQLPSVAPRLSRVSAVGHGRGV